MILRRVQRAFTTIPRPRDWAEGAVAIVVFAALAGLVSKASGLAYWSPRDGSAIAIIALRAFFIPALAEELVFRAALIPAKGEDGGGWISIAVSTLAFTAWHVAETTFLPGSGATFLRLDFLLFAATLGLTCAVLRWRSGSIWTSVALHWIVVVAWQGWFGGPAFGVPQ